MKKLNFYLPLFWKFVIAIVLTVFVFGSINAYLIFQDVQKSLERESEKRVIYIGKNISQQIVTPLLFEDYVAVQKLLDGAKQIDSTIVYIFVQDEKNTLISTASNINLPNALLNANFADNTLTSNIKIFDLINNKHHIIVRDIALPILGGQLGTVRVGISEKRISEDITKTITHFWLMVGLFLVLGIIGAFIFATFITNPIKNIQNAADKLDLNSLEDTRIKKITIRKNFLGKIPALFRAKDEIDLLTEKFNDMISRLTNAYQELKNAESQLIQSEKLATIGTIFAGLAHEINNPVLGIRNCLRRIANDPQNIEQNTRYIDLMEKASKRIESVIRNLLNYSRLEDLQFEKVNINEQIENSLLLVAFKLENSRITITRNRQNDYIPIYGSKIHIEQVIVNLLLNAIDAIDDAGENSERTIKISVSEEGKFVKLNVKDSGIGISQDEVNKIFEPFFTTKAASKGTGLGLSIVYNIVNSHGGKIEVESEENKGTAFIILLPKFKGA